MNHLSSVRETPDFDPEQIQVVRLGKRPATLADKIRVAFHAACDKRDLEVARSLIGIYEMASLTEANAHPDHRRHTLDLLVAAHERLWNLKAE